jgi:polyvinyl alcohol dehydrogenase (cytochrome)
LWSFDMIPNTPEYEGYYGISIWGSQFPIDVERNAIYIPTGNIFTVPQSVAECEKTRDFGEPSCIDPEVHFDAIVALDLTTGAKLWSYRTQAYESYVPACLYVPDSDPVCPDPLGNDYDVSTAPAFFTTVIDGASIDAMAFGSKSGWMFALRRDTGGLLWKRQIGPGSNLGGAGGLGIATDGKRIYCQSSNAYKWTFAMQETGGNYAGSIWAALDPATGNVLWVRRDPNSNAEVRLTHMSRCYGPITVTAGGVMFAGTTDVNGTMYALDVETGEILWSYLSGPGSVASSPSIVDGRLFWGNGYAKWGGYGGNTLFSFTLSSPSASVLIA